MAFNYYKDDPGLAHFRVATPYSVGYDLCAADDGWVWPFSVTFFRTRLRMAVPTGHAGVVASRSGLGSKKHLVVAQGIGIVDPDYRGEVFIPLRNLGFLPRKVKRGDYIAQLLFIPALQPAFGRVFSADDLGATQRDVMGFGHSG